MLKSRKSLWIIVDSVCESTHYADLLLATFPLIRSSQFEFCVSYLTQRTSIRVRPAEEGGVIEYLRGDTHGH